MSLLHSKHEKFFNRCLIALPSHAASEDSNKLAIIYFCLQGLEILNKFNLTKEECKYHEEFIWSQFYLEHDDFATFRSTSYYKDTGAYDFGNLSACFFAIASLITLNSNLEKLHKNKLMKYLQNCQIKDGINKGGFVPSYEVNFGESDLRQCYMALLIRQILLEKENKLENDIDLESLQSFILDRLNVNGGFSSTIMDEPHLGFTFCAIASLKLLKYPLLELEKTKEWLIHRQTSYPSILHNQFNYEYHKQEDIGGFNGRENKLSDTCYSWWCTGSLALIDSKNLIYFDTQTAEEFLLNKTQNSLLGGFSPRPFGTPDPMHSFLALASLSLWNNQKYQLNEINMLYVICKKNISTI
ncbi:CDC43 [Candida jiufengensis]|uniref:CDC43 n=1 Tax=Candida jiufengensis TaxID=497108 RepID=UPI00222407FF|nr:CDC43 [Candida jiufengensis]KAI5954359.1 CDC43 [Candida jiufengensis]